MRRTTCCPVSRGACRAPADARAARRRLTLAVLLCGVWWLGAADARLLAQDALLGHGNVTADAGFGQMQGFFAGTVNVNSLVGANRFYNAGFTGTNAAMANIEAGYVWSGHETLGHVQQIPSSGALGEFDRHATWVGMIMGGRPGGANPGQYQFGIASDAELYSGAIATTWTGPRYTATFSLSNFNAVFGPYRAAMQTGILGANGTRRVDVVNSSWTASGQTGNDTFSGVFDALAFQNPRTLMVTAAGNTDPATGTGAGPNKVRAPASAFNDLTVAALAFSGGKYDVVASFSNGGPNDYFDPNSGFVSAIRQVVDIAAPGDDISSAYYGGQTGGNSPVLGGNPGGLPGGPDYYSRAVDGTSVAAPIVSGGVALLYDAAYSTFAANPDARDARVMKAVLKNAADKLSGWNNGQIAHPNGNGGVLTTRGLDDRIGAGRMNLDRAFDQFLSGTTDVAGAASGFIGTVQTVGWDFGQVTAGTTNDYLFDSALIGGTTFTATLDWFRHRETVAANSFTDLSYQNLDLELWSAAGGTATALIAESKSLYNNSEHFSFAIPATGDYLLRVRLAGELFDVGGTVNSAHYGLAWAAAAVPEPGTLTLSLTVAVALIYRRRPVQRNVQ